METFKAGDKVCTEDGVEMIVIRLSDDGNEVVCKWKDREDTPHTDTYPTNSLQYLEEWERNIREKQRKLNENIKNDFDPYD